MNPYACAECDWQYDTWKMGDRVSAEKRHQLEHLIGRRNSEPSNDFVAAARRLISQRLDPPPEAVQLV